MSNQTITSDVNIDTKDRVTSADENVVENCRIQFPSDFNIRQIRLIQLELPISYYNIRNINTNYLKIDFDELDGSGEKTATVPAASLVSGVEVGYTLSEFLTAITTAMNSVSTSADHTYSVTHSTVTNKITITNTDGSGANFKMLWLTGTNKLSSIASMLGFSNLLDLDRASAYTGTRELNINVTNIIDLDSGPVKLPVGSYTFDELINQLETTLATPLGGTATVTLDNITNKVTITGSIVFELLFLTGDNRFISSFRDLIGYSASDFTGASTYTSDTGTINLAGDNYIYLKSESVFGNDQGVVVGGNEKDDQILARIRIDESQDGVVFFTNPSEFSVDVSNVTIPSNQFHLKLTYRNNQPVDLNGHNYSALFRVFFTT